MSSSSSDVRRLMRLGMLGAFLYAALFTLLPLMNTDEDEVQRQSLMGLGARVARWLWGAALTEDPALELWRRLLVIGVFVALLVTFGLQLRAVRMLPSADAFSRGRILAVAALCSLPMVLTDFPFYTDIHSYIAYGRVPVVYGGNPYIDPPILYPDIYVENIAKPWRFNTSLYGPVWAGISAALVWMAEGLGKAPWAYLLLFKLCITAAFLGCTALVHALAARLRPGRETLAAVAFGWNPLILAEGPWNVHNDMVMLFGTLLGFWLLARGRPLLGLVPLMAAVLVKWVVFLAVPLYVLVWMRRSASVRVRARRLGASVLLASTLGVAAFAPFWGGEDTLHETVQMGWGRGFTANSLGALVLSEHARATRGEPVGVHDQIFAAYAPVFAHFERTGQVDITLLQKDSSALERGIRLATAGALGLVWLFWVWRVRDLESLLLGVGWSVFIYFAFACLYFWPWYLVTLLGLAAAVPDRRLFPATLLLSVTAWAIYMGDAGWIGDLGQRFRGLLAFGPPLVFLVVGLLRARAGGQAVAAGEPPVATPAGGPAATSLPPGPGPLRRIAYLLRFGLGGDKDRIIAELIARYGPVVRVHPYVVTWGPDANRLLTTSSSKVLVTWDNPAFPSLASMDGDVHVRHRKVVMKAFHPRRLAGYVPRMNEVLAQRTAAWDGTIDIYPQMDDLALDTLLVTMLGIQPGTAIRDRFLAAYRPLIERADPGGVPVLRGLRVRRARREMWALLAELVAARRQAPGDDALSTIVAAGDAGEQGPLTDRELIRYAYMLMDFGQGDIAIYLTYLLAVVATRPDLADAIRQENAGDHGDALLALETRLPETFRLLLEVERVYAPVMDIHRTAADDIAFAGYRIPRGCHVVSSLALTHGSSELFARPERFDPGRFAPPREEHRTPFALMGFGAGRHMCVAALFCRLHAALVLHALLLRFELRKRGSQALPAIDYRKSLQQPSEPILIEVRPRSPIGGSDAQQ